MPPFNTTQIAKLTAEKLAQFKECKVKLFGVSGAQVQGMYCAAVLAIEGKLKDINEPFSLPLNDCDAEECGCFVYVPINSK